MALAPHVGRVGSLGPRPKVPAPGSSLRPRGLRARCIRGTRGGVVGGLLSSLAISRTAQIGYSFSFSSRLDTILGTCQGRSASCTGTCPAGREALSSGGPPCLGSPPSRGLEPPQPTWFNSF